MAIDPDVRFYLAKTGKDDEFYIMLDFSYQVDRLRCTTGRKIRKGEWDDEKQRPKGRRNLELTEYLDDLRNEVRAIYRKYRNARKLQTLTPGLFKRLVKEWITGMPSVEQSKEVLPFIKALIEENKLHSSGNTLPMYQNIYNHLKTFVDKNKGGVLYFTDCDLSLFLDLRNYFFSLRLSDSTTHRNLKHFKGFLRVAADRHLIDRQQFDYIGLKHHLKVTPGKSDKIALSEDDIKKLFDMDLSGQPKRQLYRDWFIVACYTGLRYSDWDKMKFVNKEDEVLEIITEKTGERVSVPLHPFVKEIFERYSWDLPPVQSQPFNDEIKEICKDAGLTEMTNKKVKIANQFEVEQIPKYKRVASHTGRRSFTTILLQKGVPESDIMKITGHKSHQAFKQYDKEPRDAAAKRVYEMWITENDK